LITEKEYQLLTTKNIKQMKRNKFKLIGSALFSLFVAMQAQAQDAVQANAPVASSGMTQDEVMVMTLLGALVLLIVAPLIALSSQLYGIIKTVEERTGVKRKIPALGSGNLIKEVQSLFAGGGENELMEGHTYDGIQEMDNGMPRWLSAIFYVTIIFGIIYLLNYEVFKFSPYSADEYNVEVAEATVKYNLSDKVKIKLEALTDKEALDAGKVVYEKNCAVCHGKLGEGGVGPNMTDNYWLHGGALENIFNIIRIGVPEKGMIAWKAQFKDEQILQVASYILTLKGTNPPNAKAPQGTEEK
jgi:cytochrome c oxidase cbb3-type subunit 3